MRRVLRHCYAGVRLIGHHLSAALDRGAAWLLWVPRLAVYYAFNRDSRRLHIGAGSVRLAGWINADLNVRADLVIDIRLPLPFPADFLERIHSEHVLEHVSYRQGVKFLREAHRVLAPGGVIRIAMPDLDDLVDGYSTNWRRFDWVNWPEHAFIRTRAEMLNMAFRWWGHKHLYNREELARALTEAGFRNFHFPGIRTSEYEDLRNLETRKDSVLIAEAVRE